MKFFTQRRVAISFILGIFFILFSAIGTFVITLEYQNTVNQLSHDNEVQSSLSNLLLEVDDAETGQRGYLITGNASYLAPYQSALATINRADMSLETQIAGVVNLTELYQQLQPILAQKLSELNQTISLRNTEGFDAAQAVVNTNIGQQLMNEIRQLVGSMSDYVSQMQATEKSAASTQSSQRIEFALTETVIALGAFSFAGYSAAHNLEREQKARRESELLQDILAHDIRNYNQVSKIDTEILLDIHKNDQYTTAILESLMHSIDGSTQLVERAKKLGRVLAEEKVHLSPVLLLNSIEASMSLVKNSSKGLKRTIVDEQKLSSNLGNQKEIAVMADELLDDVFTNIYSNSVKYSEGDEVFILTTIERADEDRYWKISISDRGRGIPDDQKEKVFERYLSTSKGSGLGMSIVHALVVERYQGAIKIRDTVPDEYKKGTTVEIRLRKADYPSAK